MKKQDGGARAYELTPEEWELVQGYREGKIPIFDTGRTWIDVCQQESQAIHLWRTVRFGDICFTIKEGKPVAFRAGIEGHLDKPLVESQVILLQIAASRLPR